MVLERYDSALRMRTIMRKVALKALNDERPIDKLARVIDIDRGAGYAYVVYSGDTANTLRVKMYPGRQPQFTDRANGDGNGSIVRVSGLTGSRYLAEVLSEAPHQISAKFYAPMIASAGSMADSLYNFFALQTTAAPPADSSTFYSTGVLNFPSSSGTVEVSTEMTLADGTGYQQVDSICFDNTATKNVNTLATNVRISSAGMSMGTYYKLYDGADDGFPGTLGMLLSQQRATGSTKSPVHSNILLKCFALNAQLVRIADGI